jgi:hypothetical protein
VFGSAQCWLHHSRIDAPTVLRNLSIGAAAGVIGGRPAYARFERNGFTVVKKWTTMRFGRSVVARKN